MVISLSPSVEAILSYSLKKEPVRKRTNAALGIQVFGSINSAVQTAGTFRLVIEHLQVGGCDLAPGKRFFIEIPGAA